MPTVELFWFNASKAYQSDPSILIAPLKKLAPVPGCKEIFYGHTTSTQNPQVYSALFWDQYEDHIKFTKTPEYPGMVKDIEVAIGGNPQVTHIDFNGDATIPLGAPQTELSILTLKPDQDLEALKLAIEKYAESRKSSGITALYGETKEVAGRFVLLSGLGVKDTIPTIGDLESLAVVERYPIQFQQVQTEIKNHL